MFKAAMLTLFTSAIALGTPTAKIDPTVQRQLDAATDRAEYIGSLAAGQALATNDVLRSPNYAYALVVQQDGNVVQFGPNGVVWSTWHAKNGVMKPIGYYSNVATNLTVQSDGNLVAYGAGGVAWAADTYGFTGNVSLALQNDGNLVLYGAGRALWSSLQGNFVRWDNMLQGCFALPQDPSLGFCIYGNVLKSQTRLSGEPPLTFRCGHYTVQYPHRVTHDGAQGKLIGFRDNGFGVPLQTNNAFCHHVAANGIGINPSFSPMHLNMPWMAGPLESNHGAVVTYEGVTTAKAGFLMRVPSILGL